MTTTSTTQTWRNFTDQLTPAQSNHLAAVERLALANADNPAMRDTARATLDSLHAEAAWYAAHNAIAGDGGRDADRIDRLRLLMHEVDPAQLDSQDRLAVISLLQRAMAAKGVF